MLRFAVLAAACLALSAPALARDHAVPADQTTLVRLPSDAEAVVVGNPSIADVTLYDARTVFVTGKLFGRTNLIALDAEGRVIHAADVAVGRPARGALTVHRGVEKYSYACADACEHEPQVGDEPDWFGARNTEQNARLATSVQGAETTDNGGN